MPTLYGAWQGPGYQGRLYCVYTRSYTAGQIAAIFTGTIYLQSEARVTDSSNTWAISGDDGSHSGSNNSYNFPSGGGQKAIYSFSFQVQHDGVISASVAGVDAFDATITATFTMDAGTLAPYLLNSNYSAVSITPTGFTTSGLSGSGNGLTITSTQVEVNTVQSDSGAVYTSHTGYSNIIVTGLKRATLYYFRMRISNGLWSAWGAWKSFTTLPDIPGVPADTWLISNIDQTTAAITANTVTDDGGTGLTGWDVMYNLTETDVGATTVTTTDPVLAGPMVDLLPGTTYFVRIRTKNAQGLGGYTAWKSFITLPGVFVRVDGVYKNAVPYVKVDGEWKTAIRYVKVEGVWVQ